MIGTANAQAFCKAVKEGHEISAENWKLSKRLTVFKLRIKPTIS